MSEERKTPRFCQACGAQSPERARFCPTCGEKLSDTWVDATQVVGPDETSLIEDASRVDNPARHPVSMVNRAAVAIGIAFVVFLGLYATRILITIFTGTAMVRLENDSTGMSTFFVDGVAVCKAGPDTYCNVELHTWAPHTLSAWTTYSETEGYNTPVVTLQAKDGEIYRFLSCGQTGTPGSNCGLFGVSTVPAQY